MKIIEEIKKIIFSIIKKNKEKKIYEEKKVMCEVDNFVSIWDYLQFRENTQAWHLSKTIGFEEWVSMKEIMRRIKELFGIEYKHEKSLYPYLKALTDSGLFETIDVGGIRKWRKKEILIKLKTERVEREVDLEKNIIPT
ncbi:MAG: hypothetical protein N3D73_01880 [Candidatus Diapherotrites archaeon]|nr:hypothetical protein [Candidatus Diapherotrites archaeon]